jgi:hypothetical protein
VEKWAKNGQMVQNCYPLSPYYRFLFRVLANRIIDPFNLL